MEKEFSMARRNWWSETEVDGRKNLVTFGPQGIQGGFRQSINQRVDGMSRLAAHIQGRYIGNITNGEKELELAIYLPIGEPHYVVESHNLYNQRDGLSGYQILLMSTR